MKPRRLSAAASCCAFVLAAASSCLPPSRPSDADRWLACLITPATLTFEPTRTATGEARAVIREGGNGSVLLLSSRWGAGGLIAQEHTWGELLLPLPATLRRAELIKFATVSPTSTSYAEGHSRTSYRSHRVVGTVTVRDYDDSEVTIDVDLHATDPIIDVDQRGAVPLRGVVKASRVTRQRACY